MTAMYVVRFLPHGGGLAFEGRFRTAESARKVFDKAGAHATASARFFMCDDFGFEAQIHPNEYSVLLLATDKSAASDRALMEANNQAQRVYQGGGMPLAVVPGGSTH